MTLPRNLKRKLTYFAQNYAASYHAIKSALSVLANPPFQGFTNECAVSHAYNLGVTQEYLAKTGALALSYGTVKAILFLGNKGNV